MTSNVKWIATTLLVGSLAAVGPAQSASVVQPSAIPQSLQVQHTEILDRVAALAGTPTPVGTAARQLQTLLLSHMTYLETVILPPLALLPTLADEDVTPDMKWALPLVERARTERDQQARLERQITGQLVQLFGAAQQENNAPAGLLAQQIAAYMLNETEIIEPAARLVGKYLRVRFTSG